MLKLSNHIIKKFCHFTFFCVTFLLPNTQMVYQSFEPSCKDNQAPAIVNLA